MLSCESAFSPHEITENTHKPQANVRKSNKPGTLHLHTYLQVVEKLVKKPQHKIPIKIRHLQLHIRDTASHRIANNLY